MELKKNGNIEFDITGMTHDGSGVGRFEDYVVFVPFTAPHEHIKARVLAVKKNLAYAKLLEVVTPSPARLEPDCPVFGKCGGCAFRHLSYEEELRIKWRRVADALSKIGGFSFEPEPILASPEQDAYRNKAQYPVGFDAAGTLIAGFYAPHSHRIVSGVNCLLQPPVFSKILNAVTGWMKAHRIEPYDEKTGRGLIRHIFIRQAKATSEVVVCLVINGAEDRVPHKNALIDVLTAASKELVGIVLNINKANTNVIMGKECVTIFGRDFITDTLGDVSFEISPLSFYQVNSAQAQRLYSLAAEFAGLSGTETLLDLYCGTGTIGLFMAKNVKNLIGVEIVPQAVKNAERNAQQNGITNARFICADAGHAAKQLEEEGCKPDVVVLDPPRKGCDANTMDSVVAMNPDRIVYVSCDPATLARDLKLFISKGYTIQRIKPVDMFPRTSHVETVVLMSRMKD